MADLREQADMANGTCLDAGCDSPARARGYCSRCYKRKRYSGELAPLPKPTPLDRLLSKVQHVDDCWLWQGSLYGTGYGQICTGKRGVSMPAHRFAYELLVGPIPDGLQLDHLCRNRACVRPEHLEPVSQTENVRRGARHRLGERDGKCGNGHEMAPDNIYVNGVTGRTRCRECKREAHRRWERNTRTVAA